MNPCNNLSNVKGEIIPFGIVFVKPLLSKCMKDESLNTTFTTLITTL